MDRLTDRLTIAIAITLTSAMLAWVAWCVGVALGRIAIGGV